MNAKELLDAVAAKPGFRRLPPPIEDLDGLVQCGEIQIASTSTRSEASMRKVYKSHTGNQALTLVLVADADNSSGRLRVIGPDGGSSTEITVSPDLLLKVISDATSESTSLKAVQTLVLGLDSISIEGTAGLRVRGLGTEYLYAKRLRRSSERWNDLIEQAAPADGHTGDWLGLLKSLGYELVDRKPNQGRLVRHKGRTVAVVHSYQHSSGFSKLDDQGSLPEGKLLDDCVVEGAEYGILAAGSELRMIVAEPSRGGAVGRYLELNAAFLSGDDFPLLGLLSPRYLANGGFSAVLEDAHRYGAELKDQIDRDIRQEMLPVLGRALGEWAASEGRDLDDEAVRVDLQDAALTFIFRLLFLLYAESSGFLPMSNAAYRENSLTRTVELASEERARGKSDDSTALWRRVATIVSVMRTGKPAWDVPGYNGELFAADGFAGAQTLETIELSDATIGRVLVALGRGDESGVDFSSLEIGHLGNIYEGLLSLKLARADKELIYDEKKDRYVIPSSGADAEVLTGELVWTTNEGGRKAGGVYYTREEVVRHLVRKGVLPRFLAHLEEVEATLKDVSPEAAATKLFDFHVIDPACGSAHFLVAVVDELADEVAKFLGRTPLKALRDELDVLSKSAQTPRGYALDDAQLLRRLIVKHCVHGVDVSPMGAEIAKLSLWLASFVPGLSLVYLGRNVVVGNSLIGVSRPEQLRTRDEDLGASLFQDPIEKAMQDAAASAGALASTQDRTPDEYAESRALDGHFEAAVRNAKRFFDLWCAGPLGVAGARELAMADGVLDQLLESGEIDNARLPQKVRELVGKNVFDQSSRVAEEFGFLHWPLEFPHVFEGGRGGFDAVVGNPPWEEVATGELFFYARYQPGIAALPQQEREQAVAKLKTDRPELAAEFAREEASMAQLRKFLGPLGGYKAAAGDTDLYKLFCQRYDDVLRDGGALAVVLPRTAFQTKGSAPFREWLFTDTRVERIDFLLNNRRWVFDIHPQYSVALVIAAREAPSDQMRTAGVAASLSEFSEQSASEGVITPISSLGPGFEVPLLEDDEQGSLLAKLRESGSPLPLGGGRWVCFPVAEFHETNDKKLWTGVTDGWPLWKGASFDQFDPHGAEARVCDVEGGLKKAMKSRPGMDSLVAQRFDTTKRAEAVARTVGKARIAFRDVTNRTNSRTTIACLIPPETFLTNKAPYLTFVEGDVNAQLACLGVLNSTTFDWQSRCFVEINMNYFILELLRVPDFSDEQFESIAAAAAELSCIDDRYSELADEVGITPGPISDARHRELRVEIDAQVARAWNLAGDEMELVFDDFTEAAIPPIHRQAVIARLKELA